MAQFGRLGADAAGVNLRALLARPAVRGRPARRAAAVLAAGISVAAGTVVLSAGAAAAVPSCAAAGIGVTALHGPVFYIDPSNSPALTSAYAGYQVTNSTGAALTDTWVELSGFTGGSVVLGSGQPAAEQVASLASGASKSLFWYLTASGASSSAQSHTVTVYAHQPGLANASALCTTTGGFGSVATTIGANANKITSVTLSSAAPTLGATFAVTVAGNTGTIGQGPPAPSADPQAFWMSPSAIAGWPAGAYRLVGTSLAISPDGTAAAQPYTDVLHLTNLGSAARDYTATYTFQATGFTATNSTLLPAEQISSGTQVKHTGSYPSSIPAIAPATNDLAVTLGASPTHLPSNGGTVTYTAALAGTTGASLDSLELTAPPGASVVAGSAKFDGTTLPDPVSDGTGDLVLQGPFTLTSGTDTLSVQLQYGAGSGRQRTSMIGRVGSTVIDTTPNDLTDDSPATVDISVNTPPTATSDSTTVAAGSGPTTVPVLTNDTDADSDTLTVTGVTAPAHGSAVSTGSGVQYTPADGYLGPDSFTYTISDGNGGTASATVSVDVSDSVLAQTIDFPQPPAATLPSTVNLTASSDSGLAVAFTSLTPDVCTVDTTSGAVTLVSAGTCTIEADQPGDATYSAAAPVSRSFAITAPLTTAQAITFPAIADTTVTATDVRAAATADSGLPVVYNTLTPAVCDVAADGTITLHATGTCTLQADQPGDSAYAAAPSATTSFAVGRAGQAITFTQPADAHVGDTGVAMAATATSGLPATFTASTPAVCSVDSAGAVGLLAAGTCTITADQSGSATFASAPAVTRSFAVNLLPQTITLSAPATEDVSIGSVTIIATSDAGLPVTVTASPIGVCAMTAARSLHLAGSGSCQLLATAAGDATHDAAAPVRATVAVTAQADDKTYTLPPPSLSAGGSGATTVDVLAGDPSGQTLVGVTQPHHGHVTVVGQLVRITMPPGYKGTDSFTYTTQDADGGLHTATVTIIVPNSPPTVRVADTSTVAGTGRSLVVHLADANHDPLRVVVGPHPGARVRVADGQLRVVPAVTYSGRLRIPVTVSDGDGGVAHATVAVLVRPRATPVATRRLVPSGTRIAWRGVPTTGARYLVSVDGRSACVTSALACVVTTPFGPGAHVTVTVLGSDRTASGARLARPKGGAAVLAGTVYFATASATVSPHERYRVRALARQLARDGFTHVRLVGYTDSRGNVAYNLDLSERRAFAVAAVLHRRARVAVHDGWRGESRPAGTNATVHGRALNRRVEIWVGP
ncbi:MAG TPA: Ig-like domain-containing protein [Jatrophihabitantaceae bacterium]|nr:Ig-like domain-containing protein [Jatrophihabitantaceae bacterium]